MKQYVEEIFALCGSTKFKKYFEVVARQLELSGRIVLWPGVYSKADNIPAELLTELTINNLKHAQNYKIDMCNYLYVINPDGYIGDDTKEEIAYAILNHKSVMYLESEDEMNQVFNSMAGIEDAIEEMHENEKKAEYCAYHPDIMVDACSNINPYEDVIEGLKEIQTAMKEAEEVVAQANDEHDEYDKGLQEEEDGFTILDDKLDYLSKIILKGLVLICILIIGLEAYSCSPIREISTKYEATSEKLIELDDQLDGIRSDLDHINDRVSTAIDGTGSVSRKLESTNNILTLIGRKIYQQ